MRFTFLLGVGLLLLLSSGTSADPSDQWHLAGTFNGWTTAAPDWRMTHDEERPGTWVLEREVPSGRHTFKFVRNGDWGRGHLGAAAEAGTLEQPGADIVLDSEGAGMYRFELRPDRKTWTLERFTDGRPIIVVRRQGVPVANRPFVLDLSGSVLPRGAGAPAWEVRTDDPDAAVRPIGPLTASITPSKAGPLVVQAIVQAGGETTGSRFRVQVDHLYQLRHVIQTAEFTNDFTPLGGGLHRRVLPIASVAQMGIQFAGMSVLRDGEVIADAGSFPVPPADYVVEIRDGEVQEVAGHGDARVPKFLLFGAWTTFQFRPERHVQDVHLVGDFNNWNGPGTARAIPMVSQSDGTYVAIENPADGGHRYNFLVDGTDFALDSSVARTAPGPHGSPSSVIVIGPRPEQFEPVQGNAINFTGTNHDWRLLRDFNPISKSLGLVEISATTLPDDVERAFVVVRDGPMRDPATGELRVPMERSRDLSGFDRWTARVMTGINRVSYQLVYVDGNAVEASGLLDLAIEPDPKMPAWAMGAVWYQIFPERYRNAVPANDPHGDGVFAMDWNADWYRTHPGEKETWRARAGLRPNDPIPPRQGGEWFHWVFDRRYGGDLQGVREKLPELQELGVTALYLNPVFEAESMHKYDATDFRHIDDNFAAPGAVPARYEHDTGETGDPATWKWTAADRYFIDEFLPDAHARDMKVVIDGVFNHTGREFWAFRDVVEHGADSPYADWYLAEFNDEGALESWAAWDGPSGWLPKFRQTPDGNLVEPVRQHIFDITRRWMDPDGDGDPSDGIDGWRLDVALDIGLPFWEEWCALVREINPRALIIAEIWYDAHDVLDGPYFHTQMHYPFASAVVDWLAVQPGMTSEELGRRLDAAFNESAQTNLVHQNLFCSHDTDRLVSMLLNPGRTYDDGNRPQDNGPNYTDRKPGEREYKLAMLGVALQATYLGSPMVYYGDEYGMWGADDPTNRKPVPWPDVAPQQNAADRAVPGVRDVYAHWLNLRKDPFMGPVLRYGLVRHYDSGDPDVFVFERRLNERRVIVVINRKDESYDASRFLASSERETSVGPMSARVWWDKLIP